MEISTEPPGAEVFLDGRPAGRTRDGELLALRHRAADVPMLFRLAGFEEVAPKAPVLRFRRGAVDRQERIVLRRIEGRLRVTTVRPEADL